MGRDGVRAALKRHVPPDPRAGVAGAALGGTAARIAMSRTDGARRRGAGIAGAALDTAGLNIPPRPFSRMENVYLLLSERRIQSPLLVMQKARYAAKDERDVRTGGISGHGGRDTRKGCPDTVSLPLFPASREALIVKRIKGFYQWRVWG